MAKDGQTGVGAYDDKIPGASNEMVLAEPCPPMLLQP